MKLMHSAVRTAIMVQLGGYVCVCVLFLMWVCVRTQHLSFMCPFVVLCDTS